MLSAAIVRITSHCARHRASTIAIATAVALVAAIYAATHFQINTDTEQLLPRDLAWQQHQRAYAQEFPPHQIIAVIDAPTPELAGIAADRLVARLRQAGDLFSVVRRPQGSTFLERNALLYLPPDRVAATAQRLQSARPVLAMLVADPSLRGVMRVLSAGVDAVQKQRLSADALTKPMTMLSDALDPILAGKFASVSWVTLLDPDAAAPAQRRQFIEIDPKLDYNALRPGHAATASISSIVEELRLGPDLDASVRLTGLAPINDAQFSALGKTAIPGFIGTVIAVVAILWLALRSSRIILAVFLTLTIGFVVTTAAGLLLVGAFNLLSIAFAVLFVGLGADFAIQFSVRYRAERHEHDDIPVALRGAAAKAGLPLALAALGTAIGFFSFLPTEYKGVGELGLIAGIGMLIALAATITVLPALLAAFNPPGEPSRMGFAGLARFDHFLARHRIVIVAGTIAVIAVASPLLLGMRFDFDPIHLQNQNNEAVRTYRALGSAPEAGIDAINLMAPSVRGIDALRQKVAGLPEVAGTRSVLDLIPGDQDAKRATIRGAAAALEPVLGRGFTVPAPPDSETVAAIRQAATDLDTLSYNVTGQASAAAQRLSQLLKRLADGDIRFRQYAAYAIEVPLQRDLERLRNMLQPQLVTVETLPPEIRGDWVAADGRARVEILPKGDTNESAAMQRFASAVLAVAPEAAGAPVQLFESERTVLWAFAEAGSIAIVAIAAMLWIALRRFGDVLLTLVPLIVAGAVTMELMVLLGQALNFANVIAFPLLLGVGIAFKIYYVMAWRDGRTDLLQSTLTRAVFFSALTTATAFGSLWLSSAPGMSSMGRLMALALVCTLAAAVLFQPALMGPPRNRRREEPPPEADDILEARRPDRTREAA
ncbi:MAG TPA: MMPL family transporter [Stellaceae bacterium]|nr:MMPL family transporter [Stellaceae bacterium]